ncbi:hypothetical protein LSAT2_011965 [Lamellibrachia satsuma]|nr:hypothetical protein LSAT2_011965 [Lamellibrachia satsuma]
MPVTPALFRPHNVPHDASFDPQYSVFFSVGRTKPSDRLRSKLLSVTAASGRVAFSEHKDHITYSAYVDGRSTYAWRLHLARLNTAGAPITSAGIGRTMPVCVCRGFPLWL